MKSILFILILTSGLQAQGYFFLTDNPHPPIYRLELPDGKVLKADICYSQDQKDGADFDDYISSLNKLLEKRDILFIGIGEVDYSGGTRENPYFVLKSMQLICKKVKHFSKNKIEVE